MLGLCWVRGLCWVSYRRLCFCTATWQDRSITPCSCQSAASCTSSLHRGLHRQLSFKVCLEFFTPATWPSMMLAFKAVACRCMLNGAPACLAIASMYVVPFYLRPTGLPRNHPRTIKSRMLAVLASSSVSWLPLYLAWFTQVELPAKGCLP